MGSTTDKKMAAQGLTIEGLPIEVLLDILSHLDIGSLTTISHTSQRLRATIIANWNAILLPILQRDFSPVGSLVELLELRTSGNKVPPTASCRDVAIPVDNHKDIPVHQLLARLSPISRQCTLKVCLTIKGWEREFQRLRFAWHPEHSRCLFEHELERLRQALYTWWQFALYFHYEVEENLDGSATRTHFIRRLSTAAIHETLDMWMTIEAGLLAEVFPSVQRVEKLSGGTLTTAEAARLGWGEEYESSIIVATVMRLPPDDLLHILVYRHRYATKASMAQAIRLRNPWIEEGLESFTDALISNMWPRTPEHTDFSLLPGPLNHRGTVTRMFPNYFGGIIDHDTPEHEGFRVRYSDDGGIGRCACPNKYSLYSGVSCGKLMPTW
ncbi:hypothetical protein QBC46DRAFT_34873 [Diplogelasinospora grovesii]|uniref:F-box domain-containing protein n=1 Tax=Diplogelasinospora grovesii TaxID=303347 RepID=A0AAN6NDN5_9PEZI|nr:hypothetical protein QBC46DRAFT_34873 [Diplogelasinospora grovesii]